MDIVVKHFDKSDSPQIDRDSCQNYKNAIQRLKNIQIWGPQYHKDLLELKKILYRYVPPGKKQGVSIIEKLTNRVRVSEDGKKQR